MVRKLEKKKNKKSGLFKIFKNRGSVIDKGAIYVVVILTLLIFGGYILSGGVLPAKLPKPSNELVSVIVPTNGPTQSGLQLRTLEPISSTPYPTQVPRPTTDTPKMIDCGRSISGAQDLGIIWGYNFSSSQASDNEQALKVFYLAKDALVLGSGAISRMTKNPNDLILNPNVGDLQAKDADQFPIFPAIFITDITNDPLAANGDAQGGGQAFKPDKVFGAWKAQNQANPAQNNNDLGQGADSWPVANGPSGVHNGRDYSAEIIWKISSMRALNQVTGQYTPLVAGGKYRVQIVLHDGATPTNLAVACIQLNP